MECEPIPISPELTVALERATAAYNAMTPEQQKAMWAAQRKSWVIGNMMLSNPEMSREYVEEIYEQVV